MKNKIASFNLVADKGLDLIFKMAQMQDEVRSLFKEPSDERIKQIAFLAGKLEASMTIYRESLMTAIREIGSDEDEVDTDINAIEGENGFLIN